MTRQNQIHKVRCNDQQKIKTFNRFSLEDKLSMKDLFRWSISLLSILEVQDILSKYNSSKKYKRGIRRQAHYKNKSHYGLEGWYKYDKTKSKA